MKKSKKPIFSATHAIDCLNESWDTNTVFQIATESRDSDIFYVLSNAPEEKIDMIVDAWYKSNETEYVSVEDCFKKFGYLAVVANQLSRKIY